MKGTQSIDTTSLQHQFAPWSDTHAALFHGSKNMEIDDVEPFHRPPAPSAFHTPATLSSFQPDPLLLVTPEKSLGLARLARNKSAAGQLPMSCDGDTAHKGRPRVRFAPGTRTSPPSKSSYTDSVHVGTGMSEEDCEPRSFSAVSQKLYQPGLYADTEREADAKGRAPSTRALLSGTAPGKRFTVDGRGNSTVPVDQPANKITSDYSQVQQSRAVTAKVIRHKPVTLCSSRDTDTWESDTEIKEVFRHPSPTRSSSRSPARSASSSPVRSRVSSRQSSPAPSPSRPRSSPAPSPSRPRSSPAPSPSRPRRSPSGSPGRLTPVGGPQYLTCHEDEKPQTAVKIIREAPHCPKLHSYVFPFNDDDEARVKYDSNLENPLARPEFNSALKISEELKSVKARRPDPWGTVSETLKNSEGKRTQIQEKASSKVNVNLQSGLYTGLVDLDVPLHDLCHNVERGITLRAPASKPAPAKIVVGREPDLMEFFTPHLQAELPDLTLTGIQPVTESLSSANPLLAFDLYRHNRAWDGLTDNSVQPSKPVG